MTPTMTPAQAGAAPRIDPPQGGGSDTPAMQPPRPVPRPGAVPPPPPEEGDLIRRLKAGEEPAFEELVRLHGPRMLAVARRFLPREADAEDALQDAFLSVFRAIARFEGGSRLSTWLHRVTVNAALMRIRSRSRRPETVVDEPVLQRARDPKGAALTTQPASEEVSRAELRECVRAGLARLPEEMRAVVRLRDIEGMDLREIAHVLDIGLSTVKTRLHRGRVALRDGLSARFGAMEQR